MEHLVVRQVLGRRHERAPDRLRQGILQGTPRPVDVDGDRVAQRHLFDQVVVRLRVAADHSDVPVLIALLADQRRDADAHLPHFLLRGGSLRDLDALRHSGVRHGRPAQQMPLQMGERRRVPEPVLLRVVAREHDIFPVRAARLVREPHDVRGRPAREAEQLLLAARAAAAPVLHDAGRTRPAVLREHQAHDHFAALLEQRADNLILNGSKAGEPVEHDDAPLQHFGMRDRGREQVQRLLRRDEALFFIFEKSVIEHPQVLQAPGERVPPLVLRVADEPLQIVRRDVVLHELGEHGLDLVDHAGSRGAVSERREFLRVKAHEPPQDQALARVVQHRPAVRADFLENAVREPPEA